MFVSESLVDFVPNHVLVEDALAKTTHLAISAHYDDLEIMVMEGSS